MVAGLAIQVASLLSFILMCSELAWKIHANWGKLNQKHADLYNSRKFKRFLSGKQSISPEFNICCNIPRLTILRPQHSLWQPFAFLFGQCSE
jgi:hypothetical protein